MLVNLRTALARAPVCFGFNVTSLEILDALVSVGEASPAATILQMTDRYIDHFGEPLIRQWIRPRLAASPQAFVLHLDHGVSIGTIDRALRLGFTSVMYDGSRLALADNIAQTRLAAEKARHINASIEAEVGHVGGQEDGAAAEDSWLTTAEEARAFAAGVQGRPLVALLQQLATLGRSLIKSQRVPNPSIGGSPRARGWTERQAA